jgi:hypothetical protein
MTNYKKIICCLIFFLSPELFSQIPAVTPSGDTVLLFKDGTYRKKEKKKDDVQLKQKINRIRAKYSASAAELEEAYSLASQGWRYTLPQPKSAQAAWGNYDGRTTWWYGYWKNLKTNKYSQNKPDLSESGVWTGDGQKFEGFYRKGGSPPNPTPIEFILSEL